MNRRLEDPAAEGIDVARLFGEGDEVGGAEKSEGGVLPSHQGLDAQNLLGVEIGDGLVLEPELPRGDRQGD